MRHEQSSDLLLRRAGPGRCGAMRPTGLLAGLAALFLLGAIASYCTGLGALEGEVRDSMGLVAPGAIVRVTSGPARGRQTRTDRTGHDRLDDLPALRWYRLRVEAHGVPAEEVGSSLVRPGSTARCDLLLGRAPARVDPGLWMQKRLLNERNHEVWIRGGAAPGAKSGK